MFEYVGPTRYYTCIECNKPFGSASGPQRLRRPTCPMCGSKQVCRNKHPFSETVQLWYAFFKDRFFPTRVD